jgi:acyl-CoA reductase-like NAD-dependent aldehyde dehydrogenase
MMMKRMRRSFWRDRSEGDGGVVPAVARLPEDDTTSGDAASSQLKVFEAMAETAGKQLRFSVKRREFLQALKKLREAELAAARKHDALADLASAGARRKVEQENRASTRKAAEALRDYAKEGGEVARSVDDLVSARLSLIDAWAAYKSGD